jgi:hypothetical protein
MDSDPTDVDRQIGFIDFDALLGDVNIFQATPTSIEAATTLLATVPLATIFAGLLPPPTPTIAPLPRPRARAGAALTQSLRACKVAFSVRRLSVLMHLIHSIFAGLASEHGRDFSDCLNRLFGSEIGMDLLESEQVSAALNVKVFQMPLSTFNSWFSIQNTLSGV